jgi:Zn ribbon nucleic-acid-binding protein
MEANDDYIGCKVGDRIRVVSMLDDPDPLPVGSTGTVVSVADGPFGQIGVDWDNGRSLFLLPGIDHFEVIDDGNLVGEESACPKCGNRDADGLVWAEEGDGEVVTCIACGMVYSPDGKPNGPQPDHQDPGEQNLVLITIKARPGDLLTLSATPTDACPAAVSGTTGKIVFVSTWPLPILEVRWPDGTYSKVYPGIDRYEIKDMFVPCPTCGTDRMIDLGQDPGTGIVACSRCGNEFNPDDYR